jgi:hypothetical protein
MVVERLERLAPLSSPVALVSADPTRSRSGVR